MITLSFYVMLCTNNECNSFEPMSWEYQAISEQERSKAFDECSILANAYEKLEAVKEVDCYVQE